MPRSSLEDVRMARLVAGLVVGALLVGGCHRTGEPPVEPSASTTSSPSQTPTPSASSTLPADHDLLTPGLATTVVAELVEAAEHKPIVRVVLSRTMVRMTFVESGNRPRSVVWQAGEISDSDDGTDLVAATSFDPRLFNLSDVAALFRVAAEVSGSDERQELQINEYDKGQILMTVTTSPESTTVFFDQFGTPIPRLDLAVTSDLALGLADVLAKRALVVAVGINESNQVWADVVASPGVIERRIRPTGLPMYRAQRRESPSGEQFDVSLINPEVLSALRSAAPVIFKAPPDAPVVLTVRQPFDAVEPQIVVEVAGQQLVTDLAGGRIAEP